MAAPIPRLPPVTIVTGRVFPLISLSSSRSAEDSYRPGTVSTPAGGASKWAPGSTQTTAGRRCDRFKRPPDGSLRIPTLAWCWPRGSRHDVFEVQMPRTFTSEDPDLLTGCLPTLSNPSGRLRSASSIPEVFVEKGQPARCRASPYCIQRNAWSRCHALAIKGLPSCATSRRPEPLRRRSKLPLQPTARC